MSKTRSLDVDVVARGFAAVSDTLQRFAAEVRRLYWRIAPEMMEREAERYATRSLPPGRDP